MNIKQKAMVKAAQCLRKIAAENKALKSDSKLYKDCLDIAFSMAAEGRIEDSKESILKKADELVSKKEKLPAIKTAMELNEPHKSIGSIFEKEASVRDGSDGSSNADMQLLNRLSELF